MDNNQEDPMALEPDQNDVIEGASSQSEEINNDEIVAETKSTPEESDNGNIVVEESPPVDENETEEILTTTASPPESRFKRNLRLSIRWVIGLLIIFALGFMTAVLLLYIPERDGKSQLEAEKLLADARIESLNSEIAQLENEIIEYEAREDELTAEIETLNAELAMVNLHIHILSALSDVNAARVALMNDDGAGTRVHLSNTMETLERLESLVDSEQVDKVVAMQSRFELILAEIEDEPTLALSDLEVLSGILIVLENTFFAEP